MNEADKQALLDQLRGVHTPDVNWVPAPGWWLLFGIVLVMLYALYRWYRHYLSLQWQREARVELTRLREQIEHQSVTQTLADSSRLARRVLLVANEREEVASLQGKPWLEALDTVCGQPLFVNGFGRLLESGPYQRDPQVSTDDLDSLLDAIDELIAAATRSRMQKH